MSIREHSKDSNQERQRSAREAEELQSRLSQAAVAIWQNLVAILDYLG